MSDSLACRCTALNISSLVPVEMNLALRGGARLTGPEIKTTSCPASSAASAIAYPIFPDDRLEM